MSYIGKNPEADSVKLKGSATEPSGASVDGQVYFNTGTGSISKGMKVYKNSQFVAIDKQLGDADTMQLLKAADIPAIDFSLSVTSTTVGGNNAVPFESSTGDFDGTAAFTNSSTGDALLTDDSADLVFHYTTQATNNITINRADSATIDGATSQTISSNYGSMKLISDGTKWFIT